MNTRTSTASPLAEAAPPPCFSDAKKRAIGVLLAVLIVSGCGREPPAPAPAPVAGPPTQAERVAGDPNPSDARARVSTPDVAVVPGSRFTVLIELQTPPGWHTYWTNPGETGLPPTFTWRLPEGVRLVSLQLPVPERFVDAGILSFGYENHVGMLAEFETDPTVPHGAHIWKARLVWMICKDACMPAQAELTGTIQAIPSPTPADDPDDPAIRLWRSRLPIRTSDWMVTASRSEDAIDLSLTPVGDVVPTDEEWPRMRVLPEANGIVLTPDPVWKHDDGTWRTTLTSSFLPFTAGDAFDAVLVPDTTDSWRGWRISTLLK